MNTTLITKNLQKFAFTMLAMFISIASWAQDSVPVTTSTKTTTTEEWYMDPTYLIIGGVVLIVVIALLVRGGGRGTRD
ncbi:hypothetical protein [Chryseobacterium wangxinyae]|uniref:hypothetical protein n=1 Tax=unclassified Chryseobacterium TaxID=2593645 RepID=UPI00226E25F9|nr:MULTISPECIES: hypothetical protein [unclassified Chryseobacterium]MCY0969700.1 hypothetical protein [Chryseobacterium sp. CY353]MCY0976370.1 hypothetical protein [Chryseobacterium sp. CY350]WBZ94034.1 hypothetical protein PGH12_11170 [Chryseobacterium sp. CY350]